MNPTLLVVILVLFVVVPAGIWMAVRRERRATLQSRFGPEYDRAVETTGSRREAEQDLLERQKRVRAFNLRSLSAEEQQGYAARWRAAQAQFVDDPAQSITTANTLVIEVMRARGYPIGDFEQQAADLSVDHAPVVDNYRAAQALAAKNEQGRASTEGLRQAMVHYRALFDDLLGTSETQAQKEMVR